MPLLRSYAKPPPDKEAGPIPRRFIRHSVETKKAVPAYWHGTARISRGETQSAYSPPSEGATRWKSSFWAAMSRGRDSRSSSAGMLSRPKNSRKSAILI